MIGKTISHYEIIKKLGEGGMGEVYLAHDTDLDRKVALKFLPLHYTKDKEINRRFRREAKAAAKLNHPNIITVYEIGEFEGRTYIAMEYVEGISLREKLDTPLCPPSRGDQGGCSEMPIDQILQITTQICEGLHEAHQAGIIHRDIKPENILIDKSGRVKIADFGLARMKGVTKLTKDASTLGTLKYMSPEQYQNREVDYRTDIWSFGVVLFEMLTGRLPFQGEYDAAVMYSVVNDEPVSVSSIRKDTPRNLEQIFNKALEKDPMMRYQSMQEVLEELKKPMLSISVSEKNEKSIIVLPFVNMSPDPDQEYFSDGLTEEIITDLSHVHELRVISRTSAMMLKGTKKALENISRELNVQYVLEGSVRKAGNNLRITAQLIDAKNDAHLWAEKYNGTLDDVFEIQEKVSRSIVNALRLKLSREEDKNLAERSFDNIQVYEYYLKASEEITKFSEDAINHAIRYLQNAVDIIGDNALLYSGIAFAYWNLVNIGAKQEDYLGKAEEYAKKALLLEPESSLAHVILGFVDFLQEKTLESLPRFKKALEINQDEIFALAGILSVYHLTGKMSAAVPYCERLMQKDPLSFPANWYQGAQYYYNGQFDLSLQAWQRLYELHPENPFSHFMYGLILAYNNEIDKAISIIDQSVIANPDTLFAKLCLILKYALQGDKDKVLQEITPDFQKTVRRDCDFSLHLSSFLALINQKKEALDWLENAVKSGLINYPFLNEKNPFLENIRGEQRFKKLMERVKKEWENFEV